MRRQQMILPGLARLGLLQWPKGQEKGPEFWEARDFRFKDPIPVTAEVKESGAPTAAGAKQYWATEQQIFSHSKEVLGEAFCGRWRTLSRQSVIVKFCNISSSSSSALSSSTRVSLKRSLQHWSTAPMTTNRFRSKSMHSGSGKGVRTLHL